MRPLVTNCVVSAGIFSLGDLLSQSIEHYFSPKPFETRRLVTMTLFGGLVRGPTLYLWFTKGLTRLFPEPGLTTVVKKTAVDQLLFGPAFMGVFFCSVTMANGGDWEDAKRKVNAEFVPAQLKAWCLWPAVQIGNFWLVPPKHQLMTINFFAVGWMAYLSYIEFRSKMHILHNSS